MEKEVYNWIDETLLRLSTPENEALLLVKSDKIGQIGYKIIDDYKLISFRTYPFDIINSYADLTEKSRYVLSIGATEFLRLERERARLEAQKLKYDALNSKWMNKTYWGTVLISVLSFFLSLYATFKKETHRQDLPVLKTELPPIHGTLSIDTSKKTPYKQKEPLNKVSDTLKKKASKKP